ncbi:hypothetical protein V7x_40890 [Crateriforma conspicua]|uniref:VWFA domain-containing protein n=1 Tax=Crateriforma conspicua TaxID=2527996 RepID=A0A5C6FJU6_9PLAN|nr:VWA domain-containing protein [Crateriforma conspicua]TWU62360.1 hypothetical protein V7x_40890 [Crateriforma conspicua]
MSNRRKDNPHDLLARYGNNRGRSNFNSQHRVQLLDRGMPRSWRMLSFALVLFTATLAGGSTLYPPGSTEIIAALCIVIIAIGCYSIVVLNTNVRSKSKIVFLRDGVMATVLATTIVGGLLLYRGVQQTGEIGQQALTAGNANGAKMASKLQLVPEAKITSTTGLAQADQPKNASKIRIPAMQVPVADATTLPPGTRITCRAPNASMVAVQVERSTADYITNLKVNDFRVTEPAGTELEFNLVSVSGSTSARTCSIVYFLDQSLTTDSNRIAMRDFIRRVSVAAPHADIQALSFGKSIHVLTPWTNNHDEVLSVAQRLHQSSGSTLASAISMKIDDVGKRPGRRLMVIFSDGVGQARDDAAMAIENRCIHHGIDVMVVRFPGRADDKRFLGDLATATGGQSLNVSDADQAASWISRWSTHKTTPYYVLRLEEPAAQWPLNVSVGGGSTRLSQAVTFTMSK